MKALLILTLFLTSCTITFDQELEYTIDPGVIQHVDQFFLEAESRGIMLQKYNLIVSITPNGTDYFSGNYAGLSKKEGDQRIILIDTDTFESFKDQPEAIEKLIFHEMAHAFLNLPHNDNSTSIMGVLSPISVYVNHPDLRKTLIDNMFNDYISLH